MSVSYVVYTRTILDRCVDRIAEKKEEILLAKRYAAGYNPGKQIQRPKK